MVPQGDDDVDEDLESPYQNTSGKEQVVSNPPDSDSIMER